MSKLYGESHRMLQENFKSRKLADTVEQIILHDEIVEEDKAFIESRDMFFLSTVDHMGRPSVSYKGGDPGFVKVIDDKTLAFPSYDGNGMFISMGNIANNNKVGLLFIDFEKPHRIRAYGEASVKADDPLMESYKEANLIVRVTITEMWRNCPRYIHKYKKVDPSAYVPREACETPLPDWKKLDVIQEILPPGESEKVKKQGGTITIEKLQEIEHRDD